MVKEARVNKRAGIASTLAMKKIRITCRVVEWRRPFQGIGVVLVDRVVFAPYQHRHHEPDHNAKDNNKVKDNAVMQVNDAVHPVARRVLKTNARQHKTQLVIRHLQPPNLPTKPLIYYFTTRTPTHKTFTPLILLGGGTYFIGAGLERAKL